MPSQQKKSKKKLFSKQETVEAANPFNPFAQPPFSPVFKGNSWSYYKPSSTSPSDSGSGYYKPSSTSPSDSDFSYYKPSSTSPSDSCSGYYKPSSTSPSDSDPSYYKPSSTSPSDSDPSYYKPSSTSPSNSDPSYYKPSSDSSSSSGSSNSSNSSSGSSSRSSSSSNSNSSSGSSNSSSTSSNSSSNPSSSSGSPSNSESSYYKPSSTSPSDSDPSYYKPSSTSSNSSRSSGSSGSSSSSSSSGSSSSSSSSSSSGSSSSSNSSSSNNSISGSSLSSQSSNSLGSNSTSSQSSSVFIDPSGSFTSNSSYMSVSYTSYSEASESSQSSNSDTIWIDVDTDSNNDGGIDTGHLDINHPEDAIENVASRLGKYLNPDTIATITLDWGGAISDDNVLTLHFTDNLKVYRNSNATGEISRNEAFSGWEISHGSCPHSVYVKGLFNSANEPIKDSGYSDGVAILHGVIRKPHSEWTENDQKEITRDTVKFYVTPYKIFNDYSEHMPAVPRYEEGEKDFNGPEKWNTRPYVLADQRFRSDMLAGIGLASIMYPEARTAFIQFMSNTGNTITVSATKFYDEAPVFRNIVDKNTERIKLITSNEFKGNHADSFSITRGVWCKGVVETPQNWRGLFRGYEYFISGKVSTNQLFLYTTVFKQYNFDLNETYGEIFDAFGANGNNLNDFYQKGLACNIHIWSRMIRYCALNPINGDITYENQWQNDIDSSIISLPGYRSNYL